MYADNAQRLIEYFEGAHYPFQGIDVASVTQNQLLDGQMAHITIGPDGNAHVMMDADEQGVNMHGYPTHNLTVNVVVGEDGQASEAQVQALEAVRDVMEQTGNAMQLQAPDAQTGSAVTVKIAPGFSNDDRISDRLDPSQGQESYLFGMMPASYQLGYRMQQQATEITDMIRNINEAGSVDKADISSELERIAELETEIQSLREQVSLSPGDCAQQEENFWDMLNADEALQNLMQGTGYLTPNILATSAASIAGGGVGSIPAAAATSGSIAGYTTYGATIKSQIQDNDSSDVDFTDPDSVRDALQDKELMAKAHDAAFDEALRIGGVAAVAGLAGGYAMQGFLKHGLSNAGSVSKFATEKSVGLSATAGTGYYYGEKLDDGVAHASVTAGPGEGDACQGRPDMKSAFDESAFPVQFQPFKDPAPVELNDNPAMRSDYEMARPGAGAPGMTGAGG